MGATGRCGERAQLAWDTLHREPRQGVPSWLLNVMDQAYLDHGSGRPPGSYRADPVGTYIAFQEAAGVCLLDQYLAHNPLSMGDHGYEGAAHGATTGSTEICVDGRRIDSPEDVVEHLEAVVWPQLAAAVAGFDHEARVQAILAHEAEIQGLLGPNILKAPYGHARFPFLRYGTYGYIHYFQAYALYPEVMGRDFVLQADLALRHNQALLDAHRRGDLPPLCRSDHDMADSRGLLVRPETLDRLWLPEFARCMKPLLDSDIEVIWHCDGNLNDLLPRLLDVGLSGFQGFQYEDDTDYEAICRWRTRDGRPPLIIAGVSVTRTLPHGTPQQVADELRWLVAHGPREGLFLGASSSITPGVPWENLDTLVKGLRYYQEHGRD